MNACGLRCPPNRLRCWPRPARSLSLDIPYAGEFIAVAKLQTLELARRFLAPIERGAA
jgi:hypothetical protein